MQTPTLLSAKRLATAALLIAIGCWITLLIAVKIFPEYHVILHILMLAAEAGVVGGLADWYAVTVLFRNPFGRLPMPRLLRDHTEIIPRNKARIATSMGRFVQENFLSAPVITRSLEHYDMSWHIGQWFAQPDRSRRLVDLVRHTIPQLFSFVGQAQISRFIQNNSIQWFAQTPVNQMASQLLKAVLENDFHQEALQSALDRAYQWIQTHPDQTRHFVEQLFREMGFGTLAKGASWFGFDVEQRAINGFIKKIEQVLAQADHPYRATLKKAAHQLMQALADDYSSASQQLNSTKNALLETPQLLDFISQAISILARSVSADLQRTPSAIADNLHAVLMQVGHNMLINDAVRETLNRQLTQLAHTLSQNYSEQIIDFISQRIHEWDSSEMIHKIENEVGGDLHMIRVNGVVVGASIGLILGVIRAFIEWI